MTNVAPPPPPVVPPPEREPGNRIGLGMLLGIGALLVVGAILAAILLTRHHDKNSSSATTVVVTTTAPTTTAVKKTPKLTLAVPSLVGRPFREASKGLQNAGFHVSYTTVPSALPRGTVVAQDPPGGTKVAKGSDVRLNISNGSKAQTTTPGATTPQVTTVAGQTTTTAAPTTTSAGQTTTSAATSTAVPSLSGDLQPALQQLDSAGFVATIAYVPGDDPLGTVEAQSPVGGATATAASQVTVNVSSGPKGNPDEQTVPDVSGKKIPQAVAALHAAGLRLIFLRAKVTDKSKAGLVVAQTPLPGKHAPKNGQVLVYMGAYQK